MYVSNVLTLPSITVYIFTSEVAVLKSYHGILVKWSQYRDTRPTDPSIVLGILFSDAQSTLCILDIVMSAVYLKRLQNSIYAFRTTSTIYFGAFGRLFLLLAK